MRNLHPRRAPGPGAAAAALSAWEALMIEVKFGATQPLQVSLARCSCSTAMQTSPMSGLLHEQQCKPMSVKVLALHGGVSPRP